MTSFERKIKKISINEGIHNIFLNDLLSLLFYPDNLLKRTGMVIG